ncbi:MAG: hypothetical protein M1837_006849 [Sclerophora amabilis]|nr:MAG: hypothetical protein M1837_006849 [Sclerophora amabilis]
MDISDDELLESAAAGDGLDSKQWPGLLERILPRLDRIVHNEFPIPKVQAPTLVPTYKDDRPPTLPREKSSSQASSQNSQTANKENAPPKSPQSRPAVPAFPSADSQDEESNSKAPPTTSSVNGSLPPQLSSILSSVNDTLAKGFAESPPYTIQRLAELILRPRMHYRSLASYLRALDRVVSVSSAAGRFPLPAITSSGANDVGLLNGANNFVGSGSSFAPLGSDESLGGALLTPIPWLRNEPPGEVRTESKQLVDGPNGAGSIETVSVSIHGISSTSPTSQLSDSLREAGAVTQGELLRQEQEAGVVPVAQTFGRQTRSATAIPPGESEENAPKTEEEERPHARGPDVVGVEDMGPQDKDAGPKGGAFDVEAALGRTNHKEEKEGLSTEQARGFEGGGADRGTTDSKDQESEPEDTMLVDADGKGEDEEPKKADESGENAGPDPVDTTSL